MNYEFSENIFANLTKNVFSPKKYTEIAEIMNEVLVKHYGSLKQVTFPIDIREIVKKNSIEIVSTNLNTDLGFRIDKVNGYLRPSKVNNEIQWRIYIEYDDCEFTKRYILAHEFSHFLLTVYGAECSAPPHGAAQYCVTPMIPKKETELLADMMAAFLMFPCWLVLDEMKAYTEWMQRKNEYPMEASSLLCMLGNKAQISSYHTIICFQYVREYLCFLYSEKREDNKWLENYECLFK